jgi:CheY-like chemotaxis protein
LYIEDNIANLQLMSRIFGRRPGVRLLNAPNGDVGLDLVRTERPDLVLLDLHLPGMPGEEVLRRMQSDPSSRSIPVVILSADATEGQARRLLAFGAAAYLTKPLQVGALLQAVDRMLGQAAGRP